jgi:hypothetical protein
MPNEHLEQKRAEAMGKKLRSRYQQGESVRDLSESTGYSIQRIRALLKAANTPMRPRGRSVSSSDLNVEKTPARSKKGARSK